MSQLLQYHKNPISYPGRMDRKTAWRPEREQPLAWLQYYGEYHEEKDDAVA